jgi:Zn-dependent protease
VPKNLVEIAFEILAFLFALSVHEASHALAADKLGDDTARRLGRVTLNPWPHIDLFGTILLPAIGLISGGMILGWAKPTPVNPSKLRHPRRDDILVTAAGPASNLLVAIVACLLLLAIRVASREGAVAVEQIAGGYANALDQQSASAITPVALLLYYLLNINVLLAVFNMIPVPPLDGGQILGQLLPVKWQPAYQALGRYSMMLLVLLIILQVPYRLFEPVINAFRHLLLS